jgi:hypothetical protein
MLGRDDYGVVRELFRALSTAFPGQVRLWVGFDRRVDDGWASPSPPLARRRIMVAFPTFKIEQFYPSVEAFTGVWDHVETVEGTVICERRLDVEDFRGAIYASNWELGRRSRPGTTTWRRRLRALTPLESEQLEAEVDVLKWNGYREEDNAHAFTMASPRHISPREVTKLYNLAEYGTDGNRPGDTVRVHFFDRGSAEREARPLLDCGVEVLYLGDDGEYLQLTDPTG